MDSPHQFFWVEGNPLHHMQYVSQASVVHFDKLVQLEAANGSAEDMMRLLLCMDTKLKPKKKKELRSLKRNANN